MSFDRSNGGLLLGRLLGFPGEAGPDPGGDPISLALADIARRARLLRVGGLFGGDYARFTADRATPSAGDRPPFDEPLARRGSPTAQFESLAQGDAPGEASTTAGRNVLPPPQEDERARQLDALIKYLPQPNVEGTRPDVYRDSEGFLTVGVGHKVTPADHLKLGDKPGDARIGDFLRRDAAAALDAARRQAAEAGITDPDFIVPLASVNFQLGTGWRGSFVKTWPLIVKGDYAAAAEEAADSKWNKQAPQRVRQFQEALRNLPPKPRGAR